MVKLGDKVRRLSSQFGPDGVKAYLRLPTYKVVKIDGDYIEIKTANGQRSSSYRGQDLLMADNTGPFADHFQTFQTEAYFEAVRSLQA